MSTKGLVWTALGAAAAIAWISHRDRKPQSRAPKPVSTPSPFVKGSFCSQLADPTTVGHWLTTTVAKAALPRLDAFNVPEDAHDVARKAIATLIDELYAITVPECPTVQTEAAGQVWKWLWCDVVAQLVMRGKIDDELDDILRLCVDPNFDPRVHLEDGPMGDSSKPPSSSSALPLPKSGLASPSPLPAPTWMKSTRSRSSRPTVSVRSIPRPRRFGDLVRAMAASHRRPPVKAGRRSKSSRASFRGVGRRRGG